MQKWSAMINLNTFDRPWLVCLGFIADSEIFGLCLCLCLFRIYNLFGKKWGFEKLYIRILRLCFYFLLLLLFTGQSLVTFFHVIILGFYFQSTWIYALWIIIYFSICYLIKIKIISKWKKGHHVLSVALSSLICVWVIDAAFVFVFFFNITFSIKSFYFEHFNCGLCFGASLLPVQT